MFDIICFLLYCPYILGDIIGFPISIVALMFLDMLFFGTYNLWLAKEKYEFKYRIMTIISVLMGILGPVLGLIAIHYMELSTKNLALSCPITLRLRQRKERRSAFRNFSPGIWCFIPTARGASIMLRCISAAAR